MSGTVLKGDWIKLHRNGKRVWVRERPFEVVWRTTADFTVDDIHSVEIQSLRHELNRRRRLPVRQGSGRVVRHAITRVIIDHGTEEPLTIDVNEPEAIVVDAFADLGDRLVSAPTINLVAEHELDKQLAAGDALPWISWQPDAVTQEAPPPSVAEVVPPRDPEALVATAERVDPDLAREVSFKLELGAHPEAVETWIQRRASDPSDVTASTAGDDELFPADATDEQDASGAWVRKRRKRPIHHRLRDSARR